MELVLFAGIALHVFPTAACRVDPKASADVRGSQSHRSARPGDDGGHGYQGSGRDGEFGPAVSPNITHNYIHRYYSNDIFSLLLLLLILSLL
jgi:hypothetical protein